MDREYFRMTRGRERTVNMNIKGDIVPPGVNVFSHCKPFHNCHVTTV